MAHSSPPARPSKRPSKAPAAPSKARSSRPPKAKAPPGAPPRRQTIEVQMAWLEPEDASAKGSKRPPHRPTMEVQMEWLEEPVTEPTGEAPPSSRKKPPRLPGASRTLPPMPVTPTKTQRPPPQRNHTMEVEMNWVELLDESKKRKATVPPAGAKKDGPTDETLKSRAKGKKPIPRED